MKELLINTLDSVYEKVQAQMPLTKTDVECTDISEVNPVCLTDFLLKNSIREKCWFSTCGEYTAIGDYTNPAICWNKEVPTTEKDKADFVKRRFNAAAFKMVYDCLTVNGYKRVGYNTALLSQFKNKTVYDMYIEKDFEMLIKYYSLPFQKIDN